MFHRLTTALLLGLTVSVLTGCDSRVQEPWLDESQRALYGEDQIQRQPERADALRHRLKYSMARS